MTIAITNPVPSASAPPLLGPGMRMNGTISGPTALTDTLIGSITANPFGPGGFHTLANFGPFNLNGGNTWAIQWVQGQINSGALTSDLVDVSLTAQHSNGAVFDSLSVSGQFKWDPVSGLASLLGSNSPTLGQILIDVQKTMQNAP